MRVAIILVLFGVLPRNVLGYTMPNSVGDDNILSEKEIRMLDEHFIVDDTDVTGGDDVEYGANIGNRVLTISILWKLEN